VIEGTIPALLTPLTAGGAEVDLEALEEHVAWLAERGARCVSPLGSTGEGPSLSLAERVRVLERLARHPARVALLAGTGCTSLPETIELSRRALELGVAGVLVAPPSYYAVTTAGTTAYYARLLDALPPEARVFVYHIPGLTDVSIEDETLRELGPRIAGAKDSAGDPTHTARWVRDHPGLTILSGSDAAAAAHYAAGGRGTITMLANIFPEELDRIRQDPGGEEAARTQRFLAAVRGLVGEFPRHAALKHLLHVVSGLPRASVRPPLDELTPEQIHALETRFTTLRGER